MIAEHPSTHLSRVTALDESPDHTALELADGRVLEVAVSINRASAAEMRRGVRRLTAVEIDVDRRSAVAIGTGFRRPFMRVIPVSMSLGLIAGGVQGLAR